MTGPLTRWLRRPVVWKTGMRVVDVLFLVVFAVAGAAVIVLVLIATAPRGAP